jgi:hypothetical protein
MQVKALSACPARIDKSRSANSPRGRPKTTNSVTTARQFRLDASLAVQRSRIAMSTISGTLD